MAKGNLGASAPDAINWHNSGIPTDSSNVDLVEGISSEGMEIGTNRASGLGPEASTELGMGPEGNMFGVSSPNAQGAIDEAYNYAGPSAYVMERPELQAIEAVEGFGEETPFKLVTPLVTNRGA